MWHGTNKNRDGLKNNSESITSNEDIGVRYQCLAYRMEGHTKEEEKMKRLMAIFPQVVE